MKYLVVGNWKMNPGTMREAKELFDATKKAADKAPHSIVVVAPPGIFLRELKARYKGKKIAFAVQSARAETSGAFTGDISLTQARDAGATFAIIGHAERRAAGETNDDARAKVSEALRLGMTPVLCVGESQRDQSGSYFGFIKEQLRVALSGVEPFEIKKVVIAYEPIWAIGKTEAMSPRDMHEMAIFIRKSVVEMKGEGSMSVRIIYGGSIDDTTAAAMLQGGDVHGLLPGRASEDGVRMANLLQAIEQAA